MSTNVHVYACAHSDVVGGAIVVYLLDNGRWLNAQMMAAFADSVDCHVLTGEWWKSRPVYYPYVILQMMISWRSKRQLWMCFIGGSS